MNVAATAGAPVRHNSIGSRVRKVGDQPTLSVEDESPHRTLEHQVGAVATCLASARAVGAGVGLPSRLLLVEGQVGQLSGRFNLDRAAATTIAAIRAAVWDERLAAERGGAAPAMPGAQDHPRRIDERPPLGLVSC